MKNIDRYVIIFHIRIHIAYFLIFYDLALFSDLKRNKNKSKNKNKIKCIIQNIKLELVYLPKYNLQSRYKLIINFVTKDPIKLYKKYIIYICAQLFLLYYSNFFIIIIIILLDFH